MKRVFFSILFIFFVAAVFSQEALKSTEEEYYDFLSLLGITERPTLGYRTLSDSEWKFVEQTDAVNNLNEEEFQSSQTSAISTENTPQKHEISSLSHPWQNNSLGTKYILWQAENQNSNWFTRGLNESLKIKIYGPEWYNSYNTAAPYGQNDGALWQGRGYNTSLTAGARLEAYGFELTFKPQVSFSENREFEYIKGLYGSNFSYFWSGNIDLVQRYGNTALWNYDWGDTEARWTWNTFTLGFGWQALWLGPAKLNPMLGSNNAPSYPKIDIGLRKTDIFLPFLNWYLGSIEGRVWTGLLTESEYFDNNSKNDKRMLNGISASYSPSFIPGFTFGLNRIFLTNWSAHNLKYIGRLFTLSTSNGSQTGDGEDEDQKVSLFINWHFPKIGFEFYGELGIDDFTSQKLANPFHTAVYTIGAHQYIPLPFSKISKKFTDLKSELIFEWNNFEMSQDFQMQWPYMGYYAHGKISQGYTQKGQILGAGTGYFGNSQYLGYKIYFPNGYFMPFFHRHSPDNNYIYCMSIGKSIDSHSEEYVNYYGRFKTYRTIGGELSLFVSKNFNFISNVAVSYINYPEYNTDNDGYINYHIEIIAKVYF